MTDPDDDELIGRVLDGDADAYEGIVRRYQTRLYWVALKLTGNHEDARDATQDALIRAFTKIRSFDRKRRFYTWTYRILTNLAIDRLRSRSNAKLASVPEELLDGGEPPESRLMGEELRDDVRDTLAALPPRYAELLVLRDVEGLSGKSISEASGIGHATVRWRIHRARKLFRKAWERRTADREGR
jgi:RNA polymerase sigma-70 factor (ECF subfamily)